MEISRNNKVSVILPVYNEEEYLSQCLDSICSQTLKEMEIICVDDGSTDHSLEILKEYQGLDERIRIVTETNAGPALARNNGMRRARGEYVAFLDADDFLEPTFLEKLYDLAKRNDLDIAVSRYDIYNTQKAKFEPATPADNSEIFTPGAVTSKNEHPDCILSSTVSSAWNKLFRRSFLEEKNLVFLPEVKIYEDVYFVVTALSLAERVGKVFEVLMHHRIHSEQVRAKMFRKYYSQVPFIYCKIREFLTQHGMYAPLSVSYLNLSSSRCYKLYNLLSHDSKEIFWNLLNSECFEGLGWGEDSLADITDGEVREFVANICYYDYEQYKKRCLKGKKLEIAEPCVDEENAESRAEKRKCLAFFKKIFSKKRREALTALAQNARVPFFVSIKRKTRKYRTKNIKFFC